VASPDGLRALATLMRSTPWVEPALDAGRPGAADAAGARERLAERGFNQAWLLAQPPGAAASTDATPAAAHPAYAGAKCELKRAERLRNVQGRLRRGAPARAMHLRGPAAWCWSMM
jgi:hypothetical protein